MTFRRFRRRDGVLVLGDGAGAVEDLDEFWFDRMDVWLQDQARELRDLKKFYKKESKRCSRQQKR